MAKKQSIVSSAAAGAAPARVVKTRTTHAATTKHSKAQPVELTMETKAQTEIPVAEDRHQKVAKLAYAYWEARGYAHGYADEDWVRAEAEYLRRFSSN